MIRTDTARRARIPPADIKQARSHELLRLSSTSDSFRFIPAPPCRLPSCWLPAEAHFPIFLLSIIWYLINSTKAPQASFLPWRWPTAASRDKECAPPIVIPRSPFALHLRTALIPHSGGRVS